MHISELSVKKPVATGMFFIGIILLGFISLSRLSVDLLPNLAYPKLTIRTSYHDVGPQEMEEFITRPVEEVLATIPGIRRIQSISREGISLVTTEFLWGTNMDFAMLNVREKLDQLRWNFPKEAGRPTIIKLDPSSQPIMALSVSGGSLNQTKELTRNVIKRRLEQLKGVALAEVVGGVEREIQVTVDLGKLTTLGLTLDQVANALKSANYNLPGGTIKQGLFRYALRTLGEFQQPAEIEQVVIAHTKHGVPVTVRDVAVVTDGFAERESITRFNGKESIGMLIQKEAGSNTIEVTKLVKKVMAELRAEYPSITLTTAYEQARFISSAIRSLVQNIFYGAMLAFLVLFFFLHDFRQPTYIALSIPVSIVASFTLFYFMGINLNIMSLGGLALAVGMLVDNSIVVLENIFRHQQAGMARKPAAVLGAREVGMPITAGTVTTITVFLPVIYVYGVAGQLFREQALTVTFSLIASLVVALTLLPMLLAHFLVRRVDDSPRRKTSRPASTARTVWYNRGFWKYPAIPIKLLLKLLYYLIIFPPRWFFNEVKFAALFFKERIIRVSDRLFKQFEKYYQVIFQYYERVLTFALERRGLVLGSVGVLVILAIYAGSFLTRELMPRVDPGEFTIAVKMPPGFTLPATSSTVSKIEQRLLKFSDVDAVFATIGLISEQSAAGRNEAALNRGKVRVRLNPRRKQSLTAIIQEMRRFSRQLAQAEITFETETSVLQQILGTATPPLAIKIQGHDLNTSLAVAQQVQEKLAGLAGLKDLHLDFELGRPEIQIQMNREALGRFSLTVTQVAAFIQNRVKGKIATFFKDFDRKINIRVRSSVENRDALEDVFNAYISNQHGLIPLRSLISAQERMGPTEVLRENQQRQLVLYGEIAGRGFDSVIAEIETRLAQLSPPEGCRIIIGGEQEELQRSFKSLIVALLLSIALIYMVLAAQFESLLHPFVILLDIPVTACLTLLVLLLTGMSINVITFIGLIVLAGIAVNDSIVKIDFINRERRRGTPLLAAIKLAGQKRFRPIIMTTVTTVLGLLPMAIGFGEGAELQRPLAITILGGLILSTFISLVLVPVLYFLFERESG